MPTSDNGVYGHGTTQFPNLLLDRMMHRLRDTEWRLLCLIVRQTFGWQNGNGQRKEHDWLSHAQLRRKTGRSSAAISRAIDRLVCLGLIVVTDSQDRLLASTLDRRSSRDHMHFSLHPLASWLGSHDRTSDAQNSNSQMRNNKRNLYKKRQQHADLSTGGCG